MRILSIDLDYIMGPSISEYEESFWNDNATTRWENFFRFKPTVKESDLIFDKGNLFYLWKLFNKCLYNDVPVSFAYDHDNILYDIGDKTDLEIINIDHHHDVLYSNDMWNRASVKDESIPLNKGNKHEYYHIKNNHDVDEGAWIAYLRSQDRIKSYTWITSQNAIDGLDVVDFDYIRGLIPNMNITTKEKYDILDYDFDHMHLCLSPQYIPPVHWHLYTLFLISYETYTGKKVNLGEIGNKKFEMSIRHLNVTNEILH